MDWTLPTIIYHRVIGNSYVDQRFVFGSSSCADRRLWSGEEQPAVPLHEEWVQPGEQEHHRCGVCHPQPAGGQQDDQGPDLGHGGPGALQSHHISVSWCELCVFQNIKTYNLLEMCCRCDFLVCRCREVKHLTHIAILLYTYSIFPSGLIKFYLILSYLYCSHWNTSRFTIAMWLPSSDITNVHLDECWLYRLLDQVDWSSNHTSRWTFPLVMSLDGHMTIVKRLTMTNHTHTWWHNMSPLMKIFPQSAL